MVNPQPPADILNSFYDTEYYGKQAVKFIPLIQYLRRLSIKKKVRDIMSRQKREFGKALDIGCADGSFLFNIKQRQWDTAGLEISPTFQKNSHLEELNIIIGDLADQHIPDQTVDVVTLWHVFEHLDDPNRYLREIKRMLAPGGLVVLTVPNSDSWQAKLFGQDWFHLDVPRHLYHYTPSTIAKIIAPHGFQIEGIEHFSLEYNPYGYLQSFFNRVLRDDNRFYDALKNIRSIRPTTFWRNIICALLTPILVIPAIIMAWIEAQMGHGGTIRVYIKNTGS